MMSPTTLFLGGLSGATIFLGLPVVYLQGIGRKWRNFLMATSTGVLIFLFVEIMGQVIDGLEDLSTSAVNGFKTSGPLVFYGLLFALGIFIGLVTLPWFEKMFKHGQNTLPGDSDELRRTSLMIATGIGLHNLSEGLAIGQAFSWGNASFGLILVIGFALHNATEGFAIIGPLAGYRPSWGFLALAGLIGGGPTFLGTLLGSIWTVKPLEIFSLALASGSILYVIAELLYLGRQAKQETLHAAGILFGFFVALCTELIIHAGGLGGGS